MELIIVESPTKAKTLGKFLGSGFEIAATYGHVRDLPEKKIGVKVVTKGKVSVEPEYVQTTKQKSRTDELAKFGKKAKTVYLATDPDREGEAIAWHVFEILNSKSKDPKTKFKRIVFHEITERAIKEALGNSRDVDMPLVNAQQARRVLDRLVGYKLSPVLWRKVRKGLSAGRVQSVAVRLILEREREIEAFNPEEYWDIDVVLEKVGGDREKIKVSLVEKNGEKLIVGSQSEAENTEVDLKKAIFYVASIQKRDVRKSPPPPFTTSTLQQTAANRMGWSAKRTMQVAQSLYEMGFITYHRTDSTHMAMEAVAMAADHIRKNYGDEYTLDKPRFYQTKSKVAQEAHEAIRPVDLEKGDYEMEMNRDEHRLFEIIWKRFLATQMMEASGVSVKVKISGVSGKDNYGLEVKGETIEFDGWTKLYKKEEEVGVGVIIPELTEGEKMDFVDLEKQQKFTQPAARYNDASLIKTLEEMGIGRPSTYAPTLSTIQDRQYVEKVEKRFKPTALGAAVTDFLVANFQEVFDYGFTAKMEEDLDAVANGEIEWEPLVGEFFEPFEKKLEKVIETAARVKVEVEALGEKCPLCISSGSAEVGELVVRIGKFGKFVACSRYPECQYRATYVQKAGVACPKCGGDVILKKTSKGKTFYGCSNYPKCDFASWSKPINKPVDKKE